MTDFVRLKVHMFDYIRKISVHNFSVVIGYFISFHQQNVIWIETFIWEK